MTIEETTTVEEAKAERDRIFDLILERGLADPERPMSADLPMMRMMELYTTLIAKLEIEQLRAKGGM